MPNLTYPRQQALQNPETLATVVHAILRQQYGEEVYDWDPVTVYLECQADFAADSCAETMDKFAAMQVVMGTDAFFKRLDAFMSVCNTFADGQPAFASFNPVTLEEAAWTIAEVALNREMLPFADSIKAYLRLLLKDEGFTPTSYPAIFKEVFELDPDSDDIRDGIAAAANRSNIDAYIDEQLQDLVVQFNRIPDLKGVDDVILRRGLEEALQVAR